MIVAHASLMDIPLAFARVSRFAFSGWCAKICVIDARRRKERPSSTKVGFERRCACITLARRDDHKRERSKKKTPAPTETAAQKPRRERRNARLEKKNVGRSPHPNVPERAFPREQVDGVEHDGCCLRVVFCCLISLFVVSRIFCLLFFFSFFFSIKKKKKKEQLFCTKKKRIVVFHSFIHSFIHSSKRIMATSIKSLHEKLRADSGSFQRLQQGTCLRRKKDAIFFCLSLSLSRVKKKKKKKKKKTDGIFSFSRNRTSSECRGEENVHATSDGKRDGVRGVEIFRGRRERV